MAYGRSEVVKKLRPYVKVFEKYGFLIKVGKKRFLGPPGALLRQNMIDLWRKSVSTAAAFPYHRVSSISDNNARQSVSGQALARVGELYCQSIPFAVFEESHEPVDSNLKCFFDAIYGSTTKCLCCNVYHLLDAREVNTAYDRWFRRRISWWKEVSNWSSYFDGVKSGKKHQANVHYLGFCQDLDNRLPHQLLEQSLKNGLLLESVEKGADQVYDQRSSSVQCSMNIDAAVACVLLNSLGFNMDNATDKEITESFSFHPVITPFKVLVLELVPEHGHWREIAELTSRLRYSLLAANIHHLHRRLNISNDPQLAPRDSSSTYKDDPIVAQTWRALQRLGILRVVIVGEKTVSSGFVEIAIDNLSLVEEVPIAYVRSRLIQQFMSTSTVDDEELTM